MLAARAPPLKVWDTSAADAVAVTAAGAAVTLGVARCAVLAAGADAALAGSEVLPFCDKARRRASDISRADMLLVSFMVMCPQESTITHYHNHFTLCATKLAAHAEWVGSLATRAA
jgi:hypothetical protein